MILGRLMISAQCQIRGFRLARFGVRANPRLSHKLKKPAQAGLIRPVDALLPSSKRLFNNPMRASRVNAAHSESLGVFCACSAGAFGSYGVAMNFFATAWALS